MVPNGCDVGTDIQVFELSLSSDFRRCSGVA